MALVRGETLFASHALQGWGNILNLAVLLFFLGVQGQRGPSYSPTALSVTWRMQYALGLLPIIYMLFHRIFYLKESVVWQVSTSGQVLRSHVVDQTKECLGQAFT